MSILREIQAEILDPNVMLGSILLKLRFLAARLNSEPLADWVRHETEGYPADVDLPSYRFVGVSYEGTFSGPFGSGIQNAPIPTSLIARYAGGDWVRKGVRESIAAVDELAGSEQPGVDASNLILKLQGKIYPELACNSVSGAISPTSLKEISNIVRSRVLDLTLELEKRVPDAVNVTLDQRVAGGPEEKKAVTEVFRQTVYGGVAR
jgi:hypothetical protein